MDVSPSRMNSLNTTRSLQAQSPWHAIAFQHYIISSKRTTIIRTNHTTTYACRSQRAASPIQWIKRHVSGHQDNHKAYNQLDRWDQINVDMDLLAKQHWKTISDSQRPQFDLPHKDDWSVWHRGRRLTTWSDKVLALTLIHTTPSQQYWIQKHTMHLHRSSIAWQAIYQAYKTTPTRFKLWIPKWLSGWIPIGKKLKQWKVTTTDVCPRCGEPELQRHHILRCPQVLFFGQTK
jgi:hypothetical protein